MLGMLLSHSASIAGRCKTCHIFCMVEISPESRGSLFLVVQLQPGERILSAEHGMEKQWMSDPDDSCDNNPAETSMVRQGT